MGHRRIPGIVAALLFAVCCQAQSSLDSRTVEEISFRLLQEKKWDELIAFGRKSLDEQIDYFYLRLRLGIAYYESGRYRQARNQFEKALAFNSSDPVTQEYFYYSLLFTAQYDEARKFAATTDEPLKSKLTGNKNAVSATLLYTELGPKISNRNDLYTNAFYFQTGLSHTLGSSLSLSHIYTYYGQNLTEGSFSQFQYYVAGSIPLGKGWSLAPAFHLVGQKLDSTVFFSGGFGRPPFTSTVSLGSTSLVGSIAISKSFSLAEMTYASGISNVEGFAQYIQQFTLSLYPLGNNRLVIGNTAYYHWEQKYGGALAFNPYLTIGLSSKLKLTGAYFTNRNLNLVERNGYFVNNSPDLTSSRWTGLADLTVNRHFSMYGLFMLENKRMTSGVEFSYSTYILGLKYIF